MTETPVDSSDDLDRELSTLSVELVCLCQDLVNAKLRLENITKVSWGNNPRLAQG